eukprot:snap_masked-scaffold_7-processed-gene-17.16-mRNA-1 protein AED:1.00 eAED:1.00 QI:0/0/0/0/1/1/2/0/143
MKVQLTSRRELVNDKERISWSSNCIIRQAVVTSAYLYGSLDSSVYIQLHQDQIMRTKKYLKVYRCQASIHGLKQSEKIWFRTIKKFIKGLGLKTSANGGAVYNRTLDENALLIVVCLEDLAYTSNKQELIKCLEKVLSAKFQV